MLRIRFAAFFVALSSLVLLSTPVLACGGFFCSQVPVEQAGEQIVFTYGPDGVTAIIQIAFQGSAEDFAWVVPVTGQPTIALGPDAVFSELRNRTNPQFWVNWDWENSGECVGGVSFDDAEAAALHQVVAHEVRDLTAQPLRVGKDHQAAHLRQLLDRLSK